MLKWNKQGTCLIKESNADEAFTGIRAFREDLKLLGQLFTLDSVLLGFTSHARYEFGGNSRDSYRSEDVAKGEDELRFDYLDGHVVDEAFQSNL